MRRCIRPLSFCLLAVALLANRPAVAVAAPAEDVKKQDCPDDKKPAPSAEAKAEESPKAAEEKPAAAPSPAATHTVKRGLLKIEVTLDGTFEAQQTTPIVLRPKAWATLKVLKAVAHGTEVKQGDVLVTLDLEKIDRAIGDARRGLEAGDVALKLAEDQLQLLEATTPMSLAANKRSQQNAHQDTDQYFKVDRALSLKSIEFSLKSAQEYLENDLEELRQLEKMYKADDLTEETEEIILKRARAEVERSKFYLERAKVRHQQAIQVDTPRRDISMKEVIQRTDLTANSERITLSLTLKKQRADVEKLRIGQTRAKEKLNHLLADRNTMTVKAPVDGIVYYGKASRGKFSAGATGSSIAPHKTLTANTAFMTIVQPRPISVRATVPEKELQNVRPGVKGTAVPTGYPDLKLAAFVDSVAAVPMSSGSFDSRITVVLDEESKALMPAMTCKVKLVPYLKLNALTVPAKAVASEETDDQKRYVNRLDEQGKPEKRYVTIGKRTAEKIEIIEGLSEGDKILLGSPEAKKK